MTTPHTHQPSRGPWPLLITCALLVTVATACTTELLHDLDETEANAILVTLEAAGLEPYKSRDTAGEGWRVEVPREEGTAALRILQSAGLPRRSNRAPADAGRTSLIPSASEEDLRVQAATESRLESSIAAMDGVLDARVHLVLPRTPKLARRPEKVVPKASVLVKVHKDATQVTQDRVEKVVAGGVDGLIPEQIQTVIVIESPPTLLSEEEVPWTNLGPFRVSRGSKSPLQGLLAGLLLLIIGQSIAVGVLVVRLRRQRASADGGP